MSSCSSLLNTPVSPGNNSRNNRRRTLGGGKKVTGLGSQGWRSHMATGHFMLFFIQWKVTPTHFVYPQPRGRKIQVSSLLPRSAWSSSNAFWAALHHQQGSRWEPLPPWAPGGPRAEGTNWRGAQTQVAQLGGLFFSKGLSLPHPPRGTSLPTWEACSIVLAKPAGSRGTR